VSPDYNSADRKTKYGAGIFDIRGELLICLLLTLCVLAVYWQVRQHDFVNFDDDVYVINNKHVQSGISLDSIIWAFRFEGKEKTFWYPLALISHMLDCRLYGLSPGMHHSTNLIFHILNTLLLFLVFKRMTGELWKSALVAALFGLHPLNVESVAWIAERKNLLSTFFWILTTAAYVRYSEKPGFYRYLTVFFLFFLGLLAKPMLVTLPFALLLLDYWPLGRLKFNGGHHLGRLIWEKVPLLITSLFFVYLSIVSLEHHGMIESTEAVPIMLRVENALVSYVMYIAKIIFPHNLAVYYPFPESLPLWQTAGALLALLCVTIIILLKLKHIPGLATGWLWYLGTLVPVIGLVQAGLWPAMADRYAYIPAVGIYIITAWGGAYLFEKLRCRKWIPATASIALLCILMSATWLQVQYWKNGITLFQHAVNTTRGSYAIHSNLGNALARVGRLDEALKNYAEALRIDPSKAAEVHNNIGAALIVKGRFEEAIPYLRYALQKMPDDANARKNMQEALMAIQKGRHRNPKANRHNLLSID